MIKKITLKCGNVVMYQGAKCLVTEVGNQIGIMDKVGNSTQVQEENLDPVPISSEMLREIGFAEYKPGMFGFWNEDKKAICEIASCAGGVWYIIINDFVANLAELEKKYVHELQNAFADVIEKNLEVSICSSQL